MISDIIFLHWLISTAIALVGLERKDIVGVKWCQRAAVWLIIPDSIFQEGRQYFSWHLNIFLLILTSHIISRELPIFFMEAYCALAFLKAHNRIHNKTCRLLILLKLVMGREQVFSSTWYFPTSHQNSFSSVKNRFDREKAFVSDEK